MRLRNQCQIIVQLARSVSRGTLQLALVFPTPERGSWVYPDFEGFRVKHIVKPRLWDD